MSEDKSIAPSDQINLRCSALPRVALCPASAVPSAVKIEIANDAADMGTAVHDWLADAIPTNSPHFDQIAPDGIDTEEFQRLCRIAWSAWVRLKTIFFDPLTEYGFEGIETCGVRLTGTADLVCLSKDENTYFGLDWKSGWSDGAYDEQMKGYAWLAFCEEPTIEKVRWHVLNIRYGTVDVTEYSREELDRWWSDLVTKVRSEPDVYRPSPEACGWCPRFCECPARSTMIRAAAEHMMALDDAIVQEVAATMPASSLVRIVERGRLLEKAAKFAVDVVRAVVINAGGSIPLDDGRELRIKTVTQTEINPRIALPLIMERIGDRLPVVVSISKGALETEIKATVPRGQKGKAVEEFLDFLDRAGALSLKPIQKLEIVKPTKEILAKGDVSC